MGRAAPIHRAIAKVLQAAERPLTAEEIYNQIVAWGLYRFLARDPFHVVESQLRRHCDNLNFPSARRKKYFTRLDGGRYALLDNPVEVEPTAYKVKGRGKGSNDVIVTVPPDEPRDDGPASSDEPGHTEIQWRLLDLGSRLGFKVWAPMADRTRNWAGGAISEIPSLLPTLPRQFDPGTMKTISFIDVIWLKKSNIVAAFEVEHTSTVYSGLLRMSDLYTMQPNLDINWFLVAPAGRFDKFAREVSRPTFRELAKPLHTVCRFIPYSKLLAKLRTAEGVLQHLKPSFLNELVEPYDPAEAFED